MATGSAKPPAPAPAPAPASAGATRAPDIAHDDDPKGTFRIEGQVIDDKDQPVAGALVAIDANPPRTVETEADGGFVFDNLIARDYRLEATANHAGIAGYAGPARLRLTDKPEPITLRLREGTDDFLVQENRDRPDYLDGIVAPPLAPGEQTLLLDGARSIAPSFRTP